MMSHLDPDQLTALALEPELGDEDDRAHLSQCARCRREVDVLRDVSERARRARPGETPPAPPETVWDDVVRELAASGDLQSQLRPVRPLRAWPRWWIPITVAAALAALAIVAAVALRPFGPYQQVVAQATLEPLSSVPGASAVLTADGASRSLRVDTGALPQIDGYYELWLLAPDGQRLVSLGPVEPGMDHQIPGAIDLTQYSVVDVSREPPDGDPGHSGDSVLRGALRPMT